MKSCFVLLASRVILVAAVAVSTACGGGGGGETTTTNIAPVANRAPTATAGSGQSVQVAATVQLDGTGSTDPDGNYLTYSWTLTTKPAGSIATLSNATSPRPTFVADFAGS